MGAFLLALTLGASVAAQPAHAAEGGIVGRGARNAVPDSYIVVLKDSATAGRGLRARADDLVGRFGGRIGRVYGSALNGYSVKLSEAAARRLAADPAVAYVEQDVEVQLMDTQDNPPSWALDRIDQFDRPLDNAYLYPNNGAGVRIYVVDTGIRFSHADFGGRAFTGYDAVTPGGNAADCHGHGTHVAGTAAGSSYGVAKGAQLYAVRVISCLGTGTAEQLIDGINWVTAHAIRPAVVNLSVGFTVAVDSVDAAVSNSIASGLTYTIAAGNSNADACNASPARVAGAITVGNTDSNDARNSTSNYGSCLDLFAPGTSITSDWNSSDTATSTISGTSMASPHAAGAAAILLAANPTWDPAAVRDRLVADAALNRISGEGAGSPDRLLHVVTPPPPPPPGAITVSAQARDGNNFNVGSLSGWVYFPNATQFQYAITICRQSSYTVPYVTYQINNGSLVTRNPPYLNGTPGCALLTSGLISGSGNIQSVAFTVTGSNFISVPPGGQQLSYYSNSNRYYNTH